MNEIHVWWLYAVIIMQFLISVLLGRRCDTLSKRIDIVHRRISKNSQINCLIDHWEDDDSLPGPSEETR